MDNKITLRLQYDQSQNLLQLKRLLEPLGVQIDYNIDGINASHPVLTLQYNQRDIDKMKTRNAGRKRNTLEDEYTLGQIRELTKSMSGREIASLLHISKSTYYRRMKELENTPDEYSFDTFLR